VWQHWIASYWQQLNRSQCTSQFTCHVGLLYCLCLHVQWIYQASICTRPVSAVWFRLSVYVTQPITGEYEKSSRPSGICGNFFRFSLWRIYNIRAEFSFAKGRHWKKIISKTQYTRLAIRKYVSLTEWYDSLSLVGSGGFRYYNGYNPYRLLKSF